MSRVGVDQDHQVVGEPRILDPGVLAVAGCLLRPLKHAVHLIEVDVAEQWGDYSPNAKGNFTFDRVICGWRTGLSAVDLRLKK
jgi:hypothetical protein